MNFLTNIINKRLAIAFCSRTLNFNLPEIFGKFFEEDKNDEKIHQEYENWYSE